MRCAVSCLPPADVGVGIGAIAAHSATPDRLTGLRSAHRPAHTHPDPLAPGNMAAQLSLARCSGRVISSRQVVAPRRLSAALVQHTRRPVVARSVVEVEAANSAKHGEQGLQQRRGPQCARLQGAGPPGRPPPLHGPPLPACQNAVPAASALQRRSTRRRRTRRRRSGTATMTTA